MRTTLSLDDDVAAALERVRRARGGSLKETVNAALREGLQRLERPPKRPQRRYTRSVSLGRPRIGSLDNVAEVLAVAEGDAFR
jgi:Arc/MetJ family transcription regulator